MTTGPAIEKPGDLVSLLTSLSDNDVLFIDEIHRLSRAVEEILYPALEDRVIDIILLDNRKFQLEFLNPSLVNDFVSPLQPEWKIGFQGQQKEA